MRASKPRGADAPNVSLPRYERCPTVTTEVFIPPIANHIPHLMIRYDQTRIAHQARSTSRSHCATASRPSSSIPAPGTSAAPPVSCSDANTIVVGLWMMNPGEDAIVGRRLREVLHAALRPQA